MTFTNQAKKVQLQLQTMNQPSAAILNYLHTTSEPTVDGFFDYIAILIHLTELFQEQ